MSSETIKVVMDTAATARSEPSRVSRAPRPPRWNPSLLGGIGVIGVYVVLGVIGMFWTPYPPGASGVGPSFAPPGAEHLFGTDRLGRDIASMVWAATPLDLGIVITAVLAAFAIGTVIGTLAGFYGSGLDTLITRLLEVLQSFPALLLALLVVQAIGPGFANVVMVLVLVGVANYIRLARAEVLSKKTMQYTEAAKLAGASPLQVAFLHILPNSWGPLIAYSSINAAWSVLIVASLGFLGVGLPPGTPEWGSLIAQGQTAITSGLWWVSLFPGLAIVGLATGFYLLGDGLNELTDPRRR